MIMNIESEIKAAVENVYMLGGCRGNEDKAYLDRMIKHLISLIKRD